MLAIIFGLEDRSRVTIAQAQKPHSQLSESSPVSTSGIDNITIGMTIATASRISGVKFIKVESGGEPYCRYYQTDRVKGILFMVTKGVISRIDITNPKITTLSGAKIGDREAKIRSLYGKRIKIEPHKYIAKGHYLIFIPQHDRDQNSRIVFETDGQKVINWRAGKRDEVSWVEGCL
jgi:hypothetical protein